MEQDTHGGKQVAIIIKEGQICISRIVNRCSTSLSGSSLRLLCVEKGKRTNHRKSKSYARQGHPQVQETRSLLMKEEGKKAVKEHPKS
jgi:hypothetical protein